MDGRSGDTMEETILIDGINVCYRVEGKGEPLLFSHGMAFSHEVWNKTIIEVSKSFMVYAIDLPGFGCSDKPAVDYGLSFYLDFMKKFLDTLNIQKCALVGMSMGGEIAAAFAAKYPERIDRLVIINAKGFSPLIKGIRTLPVVGSPMYLLMSNNRNLLKRYIENMLYDRSVLREDLVEQEWSRIKDPSYRSALSRNAKYLSTVDVEFPNTLKAIKAKTLIIWGKEDMILPVADAYKFKECIENSKVVVINKCGHAPVLERNEEFNRALMTFLGEINLYYTEGHS
jgi:pimeloyl-ACP methyl ester carboxylesterase